jgi:hypothetical protein
MQLQFAKVVNSIEDCDVVFIETALPFFEPLNPIKRQWRMTTQVETFWRLATLVLLNSSQSEAE